MIKNPFPGPQPYRATDRRRFFGRDDVSYRLQGSVVANRCVTVYGPSGAGKSSVMQASVIPELVEAHEVAVVRVDSWPEDVAPASWLARAVYAGLDLGEVPADLGAGDAVLAAARRAARRSSRLMLVYLDQIEQLLYPSRDPVAADAFFACVHELVELPLRNVRVALSLREDYLGRFRDRLRDRGRLLDHGFRVGPLTVAELGEAVCQAAATGDPAQIWSEAEVRALMLQVRVPGQAEADEAEAQAAYAQIVCRALFQRRAEGAPTEAALAEPILRGYLETTLDELGPLRDAAQRLLEEHLVTADGSRTLRTEKELLRILPEKELTPVLKALEGAAILHAEEHQGSRYFELGHDWLARRVHEQRRARERREEERRRELEQQAELAEQQRKAEARLREEQRDRRRLRIIAIASLSAAVLMTAVGAWAISQKSKAVAESNRAEEARQLAEKRRVEAHDQSLLAGFRELSAKGQLGWALKLLPEIESPVAPRGWVELAGDALAGNALRASLRGHTGSLAGAAWSPDGKRIATASSDRTVRIWSPDGTGLPKILTGHEDAILSLAWSPDGKHLVTTSDDGTARIWDTAEPWRSRVLSGHQAPVVFAAWNADNQRVVTASLDHTARIWSADGSSIELKGHGGPVRSAVFHPDGARVFTASDDHQVRLWSADGARSTAVDEHTDAVVFLAVSPRGDRLVSTSQDRTARLWDVELKGKALVLAGHVGSVTFAAWNPGGTQVATASVDRTARIWDASGAREAVVLAGHELAVTSVAFRSDGRYVATASSDQTARLWSSVSGASFVLRGHEAPLRSIAWSPDGAQVLTAAADRSERSPDHTARIWSTDPLIKAKPSSFLGLGVPHSAFIGRDLEHVVSAFDDASVHLWRMNGAEPPEEKRGSRAWVANAALSPDGKSIAAASFDKLARVWGPDGEKDLQGHEAEVRAVAWSPDGKRIVTASEDRTARVWDLQKPLQPVVLKGHEDWLTSASFDPDGARVVTTSLDHTARVWSVSSGQQTALFTGHRGDVLDAAFSPDGKRIVTASEDCTAEVWSADGSGPPTVLRGHEGPVLHAIWSPRGDRIATSSADRSVRVWSASGGGAIVVLDTGAPVLGLAFLPDGQNLLTIAPDGAARTWMIDVETLKQRLASAHTDCLPPEMRSFYLGEAASKARESYLACEKSYRRTPEVKP